MYRDSLKQASTQSELHPYRSKKALTLKAKTFT